VNSLRRPGTHLVEITLQVPGPFAGVSDLGFSACYPDQSLFAPLRDVPLWIEGPAEPMRRLAARMRMLADLVQDVYGWSDPVRLTDEVLVMAFRDLSPASPAAPAPGGFGAEPEVPSSMRAYVLNLVRPVVFPFLRDCAEVAHLRLTDRIDIGLRQGGRTVAELGVRWDEITPANGEDLLVA
jgi:hypothetical protein